MSLLTVGRYQGGCGVGRQRRVQGVASRRRSGAVTPVSKAAFIRLSTTVAGCSIDFLVGCKEKRQRTLQWGWPPVASELPSPAALHADWAPDPRQPDPKWVTRGRGNLRLQVPLC